MKFLFPIKTIVLQFKDFLHFPRNIHGILFKLEKNLKAKGENLSLYKVVVITNRNKQERNRGGMEGNVDSVFVTILRK